MWAPWCNNIFFYFLLSLIRMRMKTRAVRLADHQLTEKCDPFSLLLFLNNFSLPHWLRWRFAKPNFSVINWRCLQIMFFLNGIFLLPCVFHSLHRRMNTLRQHFFFWVHPENSKAKLQLSRKISLRMSSPSRNCQLQFPSLLTAL